MMSFLNRNIKVSEQRATEKWMLVLCLFCLFPFTASAQFKTSLDLSGIVYPEGLQQIEQDKHGFLWLATAHGILRTDGFRHRWVFRDAQMDITAMLVHDDKLWIGSKDGQILRLDCAGNSIDFRAHPTNSEVTSLTAGILGTVFFGTQTAGVGMIRMQEVVVLSDFFPNVDKSIHGLAYWNEELIFATDLGLYVVQPNAPINCRMIDEKRQWLGDQYINAMIVCDEGVFLAGENGSITKWLGGENCLHPASFNQFHDLSVEHLAIYDDELLVVDILGHVYSLDLEKMERVVPIAAPHQSLPIEAITDLSINGQGTMMLVHGLPEITSLDLIQTSISEHDGVALHHVSAVCLSSDRTLWIANEQGLFAHQADFMDGQLMQRKWISHERDQVVAVCEVDSLWMALGTFGNGLYFLNRHTGKTIWLDESHGLINNHVTSIELSGDVLWLSTLGGLSCISVSNKKVVANYGAQSPLEASYLYCVKKGRSDDLWIGSDGRGLIHMENGAFTFLKSEHPELSKSIVQIALDGASRIWLLSLDKGIQCLWKDQIYAPDKLSKQRLGEIGTMAVDSRNRLLLHSSRGIYLYNPEDQSLVMVNEERNNLAHAFQSMLVDESRQRVWLARQGDLWSCEMDAFTQKHIPRLYLDQVQQGLADVVAGDQVFEPDQNQFTFHLSVPWFVPNEFPFIRYRLLGLDSMWIETQERTLNFPKLNPGFYKLEAQVVLNGEIITSGILSYTFEIKKPIYLRWWFIFIAAGALIFLIVGVWKWRERQLKNRTTIRQQQLESELQVLRSQINPHFLFNSFNTLSYTIEKDQQEAVDYVERLSDYFRLILHRNVDALIPLDEEMKLLENYIYLQQKRFGDLFRVEVRLDKDPHCWLIPPMVTQIVVENAVKHNAILKDKPLQVDIQVLEGYLVIGNNVNTLIKRQVGTGTGLANIARRLEILCHKEMEIVHGAHRFEVRIPLMAATKE
jgi:ligand-binding sensor domain-containing protein